MNLRIVGTLLSLAGWLATATAADLSQSIADASKYESGASAAPLRQIEQAVRECTGSAAQRAEVEAALIKLLAPSCTFEARRFACTQLAIIGTESSLPAMAELLKNPETAGIACLALSSNPSPKVNELLRATLANATGMGRTQLIVMLGDRGDSAAVKPLMALIRSDDLAAAETAIGALGKIASAEALLELAALRQRGNPEQARAAAKASLVAADNAAQRGDRAAADTIYNQLLDASQPAMVRRAALEGLLRLDPDAGEKRALAVLSGQDSVLKPSAIACIRTLKSTEASAKFAKEMNRLAPAEQVQLLESLAVRNDAAARAAILDKISAQDLSVRHAAVRALANAGDASSVPALVKALDAAASVEEQQTIELVLASLKGGEPVDRQIATLLQSGASARKPVLMNVLARRGNRVAVPALLVQAGSPDTATAKAAFRALGKLAQAEDVPALLEKLAGLKAPQALSEAESAAAQALSRITDIDARFTAVSTTLAKTTDVETRCALLGLFPACSGPKALAAVKSARADKETRIREAALRALAAWPDASAMDTLLEVAQATSDNAERIQALRGFVWLVDSAADHSAQEIAVRFQKATAQAKNANEKKLLLSGLARVHDPLSLKLVEPNLNDVEVQAEAAHAAVTLAPYLCGVNRESTRSALQKVAELPVDKELQQSARALLEVINRFDDFILAWQVTGPFVQEGKTGQALFEVEFPPEQAGALNVKWHLMPAGTEKTRPWQLDFGKLYGGNDRVAYARTWIYSESEQPARLELGSDDGIKAWLNGKVVAAANRSGDVAPGAEKATVSLQPGWNSLLLKVIQWTAGWGFCARVAKPDGSTLPGIRIECNPPK